MARTHSEQARAGVALPNAELPSLYAITTHGRPPVATPGAPFIQFHSALRSAAIYNVLPASVHPSG